MKAIVRSIIAIGGGFLVTAIASVATDAVMHGLGIFPEPPATMSNSLFALAAAYRALFTVAGGFTAAQLAPDRPMRHAWILACIGLAAGLASVVGYFVAGQAAVGPAWYAISIPIEAIPCIWIGGRLALIGRAKSEPL
jgi:hypothetical protein